MTDPAATGARPENEEERLRFILEAQQHCDHFLTPLADPAGRSVLVVGAGAGSEMLWCLRHGAREVVGLDPVPQPTIALERAARELGLGEVRVSVLRLGIEQATELGRRFDLVLSNNVFEHVRDLGRAFAACARLVEPVTGRIAVFSSPLYYSSSGSHLPVAPWEHLWESGERLRERLLASGGLRPGHPLEDLDWDDYLEREISLNRTWLADLLAAARASGLVLLHLRLLPDRHLAQLPLYLERLASAGVPGAAPADFALEGVALELARLEPGAAAAAGELRPTPEAYAAADREDLVARYFALEREFHSERGRLTAELEPGSRAEPPRARGAPAPRRAQPQLPARAGPHRAGAYSAQPKSWGLQEVLKPIQRKQRHKTLQDFTGG